MMCSRMIRSASLRESGAFRKPLGELMMPDQRVSAQFHAVGLGEGGELVRILEVERIPAGSHGLRILNAFSATQMLNSRLSVSW